jgi:hypothetical protein
MLRACAARRQCGLDLSKKTEFPMLNRWDDVRETLFMLSFDLNPGFESLK